MTISAASPEDVRWLVSDAAAAFLREATEATGDILATLARLRKRLSPERAGLVVEQIELRRRARPKFAAAERMFFTPVGLEQATDERIAAYKAARFPTGTALVDLCCGIGGDLRALAERGSATGVDRDAVTATVAAANCPGATVRAEDAGAVDLRAFDAWHIDPDRRAHGGRTTRVERYEPTAEAIDDLLRANGAGAVKLAPAAEVSATWQDAAELEWIGDGRECKQLVAWFGRPALAPGQRRATIVDCTGAVSRTLVGRAGVEIPRVEQLSRYVFDADSTLFAAGLVGALAAEHGLSALGQGNAYLTGDRAPSDAAIDAFEVLELLPLDERRLRATLAARRVGRLELKQRGVKHDLERLRQSLRLAGAEEATLLLARVDGVERAILARRVAAGELPEQSRG